MTKRLAYFGPPGTNAEEAAIKYSALDGGDYTLLPFPTITSVGVAVETGAADEGVMPIENTLEGAVTETQDFLIHAAKPVHIWNEIVMLIEHQLIVPPGMKADDVQVITSIPVALAQVRGFIERSYPNTRIEAALSTAAAVEGVMKRSDAAAVGNKRAAELYGAEILESGIQDYSPNHTRFVIVAAEDHPRTGDDHTSIAFEFANEDRPGQLVGALREFSDRSINLYKIESRPSKVRLGTYIFLTGLGGHRTDPPLAEALAAVEKECVWFRILGSYPRYRGV